MINKSNIILDRILQRITQIQRYKMKQGHKTNDVNGSILSKDQVNKIDQEFKVMREESALWMSKLLGSMPETRGSAWKDIIDINKSKHKKQASPVRKDQIEVKINQIDVRPIKIKNKDTLYMKKEAQLQKQHEHVYSTMKLEVNEEVQRQARQKAARKIQTQRKEAEKKAQEERKQQKKKKEKQQQHRKKIQKQKEQERLIFEEAKRVDQQTLMIKIRQEEQYNLKSPLLSSARLRSIKHVEPELICPITQVVMKYPMILSTCGHSFEESAIKKWLVKNSKCPLCNTPGNQSNLIKNFALASLCQSYV